MKGNALIRANLGADPKGMSDEQWADMVCQAIWIEQIRLKHQAELLAAMFGGKRG
jgi:2-hydroxychromene-2-carboxylate isomerase